MSMITKLRLVLAGLAACLAMLTGESNAAEKIALTCAGTMTSSRSWDQQIDGPESVVIDLDRSVVIWGQTLTPVCEPREIPLASKARAEKR
jgi:magnesium-transporting ATPase (P-type)